MQERGACIKFSLVPCMDDCQEPAPRFSASAWRERAMPDPSGPVRMVRESYGFENPRGSRIQKAVRFPRQGGRTLRPSSVPDVM